MKEIKKVRKQELDQESDQEKKERKQELDQESDQEKEKKLSFFFYKFSHLALKIN